jgi:hypothetical protein
MTEIKFKTAISTVEASYRRGQIASVDSSLAKQWVQSGIAESIEPPAKKRTRKQR